MTRFSLGFLVLLFLGLFHGLTLGTDGLSAAPETAVQRYALVLGVNHGGDGRARLRYAESDARAFAHVMNELGGVPAGRQVLLTSPRAEEVSGGFRTLARRIDRQGAEARRVEFLFYYSGHSDTEGLLLPGGRFPYRELKELVNGLDADVSMVILDSCYSGSFTRTKGGLRQAPFLMDNSAEMAGHAYLTSSSADEAAQESDRIAGSFFTHNLLTGLRGAADHSGDGRITLNEVYHYAFSETLAQTEKTLAGPQHPSYNIQLTGKGDLVLTDLNAPVSRVRLGEDVVGRLFIRTAAGRLVAELDKQGEKPLTMALPLGRYRISAVRGGRRYRAEAELEDSGLVPVAWTDFSLQQLDFGVERGGALEADGEVDGEASAEDAEDAAGGTAGGAAGGTAGSEVFVPALYQWGPESFSSWAGDAVCQFALSPLFSRVGRAEGLQAAGVLSVQEESVPGLQAAGVGNAVWGDVQGGQASGVFNYAGGDVEFFQFAGVVNAAAGGVEGIQSAGVVNYAAGDVEGMQISGVYNQSRDMDGLQLGVVGVARDLDGLQLGVVNVARDVEGLQLGVVNVARENSGTALGLVNVMEGGLLHGQMWIDGRGWTYAGFQSGGKTLYTFLYGGLDGAAAQKGELPAGSGGIGLGLHEEFFSVMYMEGDVSAYSEGSGPELYVVVDPESGEVTGAGPGTHLAVRGQVGISLGRAALTAGCMGVAVFQGQDSLAGMDGGSWPLELNLENGGILKALQGTYYLGVRF